MKALEGKVVAVTGSGRGIGRGIALGAAAEGARVVVVDYGGDVAVLKGASAKPADDTVAAIRAAGGEAIACAENVATMAGGRRIVEAALATWGQLDGLVCAAGLHNEQPLWETTEQEWDDVIASHLKGHFACTQAALGPMMKSGRGSIVHFSSAAAVGTLPNMAAYNTAKAGVLAYSRSCALGLAKHGIRVNAVLPGASTRMTDEIYRKAGALIGDVVPEGKDDVTREQPGGRVSLGVGLRSELAAGTWRDPANVAPFVVFLLSDRAQGVNGQAFGVVGYQVTRLGERRWERTIRSDARWTQESLAARFDAELRPDLGIASFRWPPD